MTLEITEADHICNVIRRQVLEEFPYLGLIFIVYSKDDAARALHGREFEISRHPAGALLLPSLRRAATRKDPHNVFVGIATAREKKLISFLSRKKTLACFFIDTTQHSGPEDLRQHLYALIWQTLHLYENRENSGITLPHADDLTRTWGNMLADAFAGLVLEMQGKRGSILALAKKRGLMALKAVPGCRAEDYPYPLVMDAALLVFDDAPLQASPKNKILTRAFEMTKEIGDTFDPTTVLHWWAFSRAAQEMAWLNVDMNKILGAAVQTSENPYARSTAYLLAECLDTDPAPFSDVTVYNAFTDPEALERYHRKACEEVFENLLFRATESESLSTVLRQEAVKQNKKLLAGQVIGWCAPALLLAGLAFDTTPPKGSTPLEEAKRDFEKSLCSMNSEILRKLAQAVVTLRQNDPKPTLPPLAELFTADRDLERLAPGLMVYAAKKKEA